MPNGAVSRLSMRQRENAAENDGRTRGAAMLEQERGAEEGGFGEDGVGRLRGVAAMSASY